MLGTAAIAASGLFGLSVTQKNTNNKAAVMANARLGMNLAGIADWGSEMPFLDLFKQSRAWFAEGETPKNFILQVDAEGWVTQLPSGLVATAIISTLEGNHFPKGDYVILYEGKGKIRIPNHFVKSSKAGRIVVQVNGQKGIFQLDVVNTDPQNYIKNIRVVAKAHENTYVQDRWNPNFLTRWSGVACLRFMDYMQTNHSPKTTWYSRAKPTDASFAANGVPVEWMLDLANRLNCDAWFCMPHQAEDDYVKGFAQYVSQHLKPKLRVWVEYSNEVWNGAFEQNSYATKAGMDLTLTDKDWAAASKYYAYRSVQIFNLWAAVFGDTKRIIRVLAAQTGYTDVAEQVLSFSLPNNKTAADYADVLAIANYLHISVSPEKEDGLNDEIVEAWSLNQLFDYLNKKVLPQSKVLLEEHKNIADGYGLKLAAYEAGQHLVGVGEATNNEKLTQLFMRANVDVQMGKVYEKSLDIWQQVGGDLICNYQSMSGWSKWGSWGLLEHGNEPTPKYKVTIDWAKSRGQQMVYMKQ